MDDTREIEVTVMWRTSVLVEVPADAPHIEPNDIETLLSYEDVDSSIAEMVDWDIRDNGPSEG